MKIYRHVCIDTFLGSLEEITEFQERFEAETWTPFETSVRADVSAGKGKKRAPVAKTKDGAKEKAKKGGKGPKTKNPPKKTKKEKEPGKRLLAYKNRSANS